MTNRISPFNVRLLCGAAAIAIAMSAPAYAADARFEIAPQSLDSALREFGVQSGVTILADADLTVSKLSPGVAAATDPDTALRQILAGTGLTYKREGDIFVIARFAQDGGGSSPQAASAGAAVEELVVTAQKREESIQDVPIAISAFSMDTLDAQKIEGGFDLLKAVPNVTFSKTNFSGYNFQIRGIGTQAISATTDPGVAVSFNNTTLIVNRLFEQEYLDIERVEVLRGPQGTLYGRNATAGVINVISAKPVMGDFFGEAKVELGNFNAQRFRGHVNVPVTEHIAVRAAFASTKRDGYGYNEYSEVADPEFRDPVSADVDDRNLWTGRITVGWEPTDNIRANFIYEHFEEDDRRVRTSKQLCTRDTGTVLPTNSGGVTDASQFFYSALSQGCKAGSLYADEAFGTPNGASLPFMSALYWGPFYADSSLGSFAGANNEHGLGGNPYQGVAAVPPTLPPLCGGFFPPCGPGIPASPPLLEAPCTEALGRPTDPASRGLLPVDVCNPDVFRGLMQSRDLRTISSQLEPAYRAKSDLLELSFDLDLTEGLTLSSQTVYAEDSYYATQDYNRFTAFPIWSDSRAACGLIPGSANSATIDCSDDPVTGVGTYHGGFYANLTPGREGSPLGSPGILCDPQLGCSDTLLMQDLSQAESKQFNQEIRLVSAFDAPWNFSLGANYTDFETINDYFVFANALTHLLNFFPFQTPMSQCYQTSTPEARASREYDGQFCRYVDPNPLESINGEGHNYFRSGNPYQLNSAAIFGELYWQATETLKLTAGLRFTWDRKVFTPLPSQLLLADYRHVTALVPPGGGPELCTEVRTTCVLAGTAPNGRGYLAEPDVVQEWRVPTGRLGFDWKPQPMFDWLDETMIYGFLSHGYKGGGANPPSIAQPAGMQAVRASGGFEAPRTFEPEYVDAIELGTKNTMFGGSTTLNLGAFYYDYTDYQVSKILDRSAYNENFDAEVWGVELEALFAPTRNLRFNAAIGWLQTRIANGEQSIDLMDRTDGGNRHFAADPNALGTTNRTTSFPDGFDDWVVLQPWITASSNCVVPRTLLEANALHGGHFLNAFCPTGNVAGGSAASLGHVYFDADGNLAPEEGFYDPAKDAPNGGQGFFKDLGGNHLPNAPEWTVSVGGQYTMMLPGGWDATVRADYYWQGKSFARVYNMADYDRLRAWENANLSLWVENSDWGVKAEVYVKNVFDETPITGAFLNSDDSGLTTNIFTLDPRLVGVSVTKEF
ncbi:MAG TPA: TonB-dependent receptor [Caulobacteraceae bacterium]|nr:TonB-dependent receptor [Caulobacteraceae bacterium]